MSSSGVEKFDGVYKPIEAMSVREISKLVSSGSNSEKSTALFSMIYNHDPVQALEMLIEAVLESDCDEHREWSLQKFDPLLQSRTLYPHPHRMNAVWKIARRKFPHMRPQISEAAKQVREYCRMWDKLPKEEVTFDFYPLVKID